MVMFVLGLVDLALSAAGDAMSDSSMCWAWMVSGEHDSIVCEPITSEPPTWYLGYASSRE